LGLERSFVVTVLFLCTGIVMPLLWQRSTIAPDPAGDPIMQIIWFSVYVIVAILIAVRWRAVKEAVLRERGLWMLVGLAIASTAWSEAPGVTARRGFALIGTTAFGAYIATRYDTKRQLQFLACALGMGLLLSAGVAVFFPSFGLDSTWSEGAWRGLYVTKNAFGRIAALGSVLFFVLGKARTGVHRLGYWGAAMISVGALFLSRSLTALLLAPAVVVAGYSFRWWSTLSWRHRGLVFLTLAGAVALSAGLLSQGLELLLQASGRDPTLTGRTLLWAALIPFIGERPLLGFGYSAFWTGSNAPAEDLWLQIGWEAPHAHNGYLDLMIDLGAVGLVVFLTQLARSVRAAVHQTKSSYDPLASWPFLYLTFIIFYNLTESSILARNSIFWVLFVSVALSYGPSRVARTFRKDRSLAST